MEPAIKPHSEAEIRAQFTEANGIVALEGYEPSAEDLALQERVIKGEITDDEAVAIIIRRVRDRQSKGTDRAA